MTTATEPRMADVRARIDTAFTQLREAVGEVPNRMRDETTDWEKTFAKAGDDALREIARYAIRAQHDPAALKELTAEVRKRKAELSA